MADPPPIVSVHSVAEAYLYLLVRSCQICGRGPLKHTADLTRAADGWLLAARCESCRREETIHFDIDPAPTRAEARSDRINPTGRPSQSIDLLGWLTLFQTILSAAERAEDRSEARQLAAEAAQCLDEAMKFYDADNDLPPDRAFFTPESLRRFREHPAHFSRAAWRERRIRLPSLEVRTSLPRLRRRWWQFWKTAP